jgi:hypothetical protein
MKYSALSLEQKRIAVFDHVRKRISETTNQNVANEFGMNSTGCGVDPDGEGAS